MVTCSRCAARLPGIDDASVTKEVLVDAGWYKYHRGGYLCCVCVHKSKPINLVLKLLAP